MPNPTTNTEIQNIINLYVTPNYPTSPTNYFNGTTLAPIIPANADYILVAILEAILESRGTGSSYNYANPMSNASRKGLYAEIDEQLIEQIANLTAVQTALHTAYLALP